MERAFAAYRKSIAERLKLVRWHQKLSQETLAVKAGVTYRYYSDLEAGRRNVTLETMFRLADALEVPVGLLLDEEPALTQKRLDVICKAKPQALPKGRKPKASRR